MSVSAGFPRWSRLGLAITEVVLAAGLIVAAMTEGGWYWWAVAIAAATTLALINLSMYLRTGLESSRPGQSADATDGHQRPPLRLEGSGRLYVQRQLVDAHHQPRIAVLDRRVSSHRDAAVAVQHDPQRDLGFQSGQRRT
jgi:hypothetical protein